MNTALQSEKSIVERLTGDAVQNIQPLVIEYFSAANGESISQSHLGDVQFARNHTADIPTSLSFDLVPTSQQDTDDPANRLQAVLQRLDGLECLGPNWDSYGSQPPVRPAIMKAKNLVWAVVERNFGNVGVRAIPYTAVPLSGGGVQLEWRGPTNEIEVEINDQGQYSYLLTKKQGPIVDSEERDIVPESDVLGLVAAAI